MKKNETLGGVGRNDVLANIISVDTQYSAINGAIDSKNLYWETQQDLAEFKNAHAGYNIISKETNISSFGESEFGSAIGRSKSSKYLQDYVFQEGNAHLNKLAVFHALARAHEEGEPFESPIFVELGRGGNHIIRYGCSRGTFCLRMGMDSPVVLWGDEGVYSENGVALPESNWGGLWEPVVTVAGGMTNIHPGPVMTKRTSAHVSRMAEFAQALVDSDTRFYIYLDQGKGPQRLFATPCAEEKKAYSYCISLKDKSPEAFGLVFELLMCEVSFRISNQLGLSSRPAAYDDQIMENPSE